MSLPGAMVEYASELRLEILTCSQPRRNEGGRPLA